ncbi:MAG: four helix bundle protein [Prevotellaceae bacterium]|nr:four helix bundle protein [Prevotellaceae bacterium]
MENVLRNKSYQFALRMIKLFRYMCEKHKEYILSKQILRSGTAIGALVREAEHAQSKADFLNKMNIALKEANETEYWLSLLKDSDFLSEKEYNSIYENIDELLRLLVSIVKTTKTRLNK